MKTKKLTASGVIAALAVAGGMALWPTPGAEASAHIRKFTGALEGLGFNQPAVVRVHNSHPTYTFKATVIMRRGDGGETARIPLTIPPNSWTGASPVCANSSECSLEVSTPNLHLHPSAHYASGYTNTIVLVYAGDFER